MKQFSDDKDYHDMFDDIFQKWDVITFFQPVIDTHKKDVYGIDSSSWLQSKESNSIDFISPGDFLTAAENSGEIINITQNMLLQIQTCLTLKNSTQYHGLRFFIKLSPLHLYSENIMEFAEDCLRTARVLNTFNATLIIEVNARISFDLIHKLKLLDALLSVEENIQFALGDFGAGHSNIEMLFGFDFAFIKINQNMFFPLTHKVITQGFADDLMSGLSKQNTDIIITGVNSEQHMHYFLKQNVHLFQGDLFSPPVAYKRFSTLEYFEYG